MKKFIRITSLLLALCMAVLCFGACSSEEEATNEPIAEPEVKVLKMATNAAFPPYEFKEGEKFVGIDIEIAQAIAEELGYELEVVDMEFDSIIASVQNGETDFGMAGMTVTDERKEEVASYKEMLEKYAGLVIQVENPEQNNSHPESIRTSLALCALYDNFGEDEEYALALHKAVLDTKQDHFRGDLIK